MTNDVINNLCEKFGVTVEYLIPRMIAYYRAEIIGQVLLFVVTLVVSAYVLLSVVESIFRQGQRFRPGFRQSHGCHFGIGRLCRRIFRDNGQYRLAHEVACVSRIFCHPKAD